MPTHSLTHSLCIEHKILLQFIFVSFYTQHALPIFQCKQCRDRSIDVSEFNVQRKKIDQQ